MAIDFAFGVLKILGESEAGIWKGVLSTKSASKETFKIEEMAASN